MYLLCNRGDLVVYITVSQIGSRCSLTRLSTRIAIDFFKYVYRLTKVEHRKNASSISICSHNGKFFFQTIDCPVLGHVIQKGFEL